MWIWLSGLNINISLFLRCSAPASSSFFPREAQVSKGSFSSLSSLCGYRGHPKAVNTYISASNLNIRAGELALDKTRPILCDPNVLTHGYFHSGGHSAHQGSCRKQDFPHPREDICAGKLFLPITCRL